jgi:Domain of unknown function (DUF4166)
MALAQGRLDPRPAAAEQTGGQVFPALVGERAWQRLPQAVRRRFERELVAGESAVYFGTVQFTNMTGVGWVWAQLARAFGAPLPLTRLAQTPATVVVTQDSGSAQLWTRIYHAPGRLPQVIRSMKHFAGPTGIEERVGGGVSMALAVSIQERALVFRSRGYAWRCGPVRLPIPEWLTPGQIEVRHREERQGQFSFTLRVDHPWFGRILEQVAFFRDAL